MTQLTIALFTGDPAGIGPELVQKLLNHNIAQQATKIILIIKLYRSIRTSWCSTTTTTTYTSTARGVTITYSDSASNVVIP